MATMASNMPLSFDFPFSFPSSDIDIDSHNIMSKPSQTPSFFPSPPASTLSDPGLEFDLESLNHTSPDSSLLLDDSFNWDFASLQPNTNAFITPDLSSGYTTSHTPSSTRLISPKSSISSIADLVGHDQSQTLSTISQVVPADTAEALSNHHLQRYLHYKALAAQAEADARATAALQSQNDFEAYLASYSMSQAYQTDEPNSKSDRAMLGYRSQPAAIFSQDAPQYFSFNPQQQANLAHAQAEAHWQAHDVAAARAQQQRTQTGYWVAATQNACGIPSTQTQQAWSQDPILSVASSIPSAPVQDFIVPAPSPLSSAPSITSVPIIAPIPMPLSAPSSLVRSFEGDREGEEEMEGSEQDQASIESSDVIPNLNGGGRGYVPGETPDDPKKRHKCTVCGRAFARAFNLKSHAQTHNPVRAKPHQCPHSTCKRGFSRLHDLERHRQGIHNDGPLVSAKTAGVSPSTARAQARAVKRESPATSLA